MDFKVANEWSNKLRKKTFFTNPLFIIQNCFVKDNILLENNKVNEKYPLLVYFKEYQNISNQIIGTGFDEDIKNIERKYSILKTEDLGIEFFYATNDWINMAGKKFKDIRRHIHKFSNEHKFNILDSYPKEKIVAFLNAWAEEKRKKSTSRLTKELFEHELAESIQNLDLIQNLNYKAIYIEEEGSLLGFCIFFKYYDSLWVGLMQKTIPNIVGLPQYLYHLKSKSIGINQTFTTGAEAQDENLKKFKESLRPIEIKRICTIYVGDKLTT